MLKKILKCLMKSLKMGMVSLGFVFLLMIVLSFTDQPFWAYHWLGTSNSKIENVPDYIVVMGAGGMPGPAGLMRCAYAAEAAKIFEDAKIIVAMPALKNGFLESDCYKMQEEICRHTVSCDRFLYETNGTSTYTQAVRIYEMLKTDPRKNLLIVTSPEHMYRCILTFEKCGFENVDGMPAFQASINSNLLFTHEEQAKRVIPLDRSISVRYKMWSYFKLQIDVAREVFALLYYKIKGFI